MADVLRLKKSNCKNCYKCIRHCPVKAIRFSGNQAHIVSDDCILCGQCFVVCPQNAKEIVDAKEYVKVLLAGDKKVIASVAPSFAAYFEKSGIDSLAQKARIFCRRGNGDRRDDRKTRIRKAYKREKRRGYNILLLSFRKSFDRKILSGAT